ncbi:hypothetical protein EBB07_28775 [Paenibacillaceae bacterium]|nr:hypothetical protein EBB07_28775 [Paenibacillaceae bacterium]
MNSTLLKDEPINYKGKSYYIHLTKYYNGKPAIVLDVGKVLSHNQDNIVLTVNLDETKENEVAIIDPNDDGCEFQLLEQEGIVEYCGLFPSGYNVNLGGRLLKQPQ